MFILFILAHTWDVFSVWFNCRVLSRGCWRGTLPSALVCIMVMSCWCRWASDRSSFTYKESWTDLEVSPLMTFHVLYLKNGDKTVILHVNSFALFQPRLIQTYSHVWTVSMYYSEMSRTKNELQRTPTFMDLYHEMEAMFVKPSAGADVSSSPHSLKIWDVCSYQMMATLDAFIQIV